MLAARLERGDVVIALGGGVIGDLAGFAAGIVRRGMRFVQIPTSLLAQVDSSVGGKTGINTRAGQEPRRRLPPAATGARRHRRARHAARARIPRRLCRGREIRADRPAGLLRLAGGATGARSSPAARRAREAIAESCRAKADVVARDELETGDRALLNLGHTFGHALEAATGYDSARLVHGEGVAIGMALAHRFSARLNLCQPRRRRPRRGASARGRPAVADGRHSRRACRTPRGCSRYIAQDKKVSRGTLTFILTRGIGQSFIAKDVPASEVLSFLRDSLSA